jgi:phosphatidylglycerol lysyltransferase
MNSKILKRTGFLITVICFAASFFILAGFIKNQGLSGITSGFTSIAPLKIALSLLFAALSYFFLIFYDYIAARFFGIKLSFKRAASVSFTANAFGNSLGLSLLSSSAVRFRLYSLWQIPASQAANIIVFCGISSLTGFAAISGLFLDFSMWPPNMPATIKTALFAAGIVSAAALILYIVWSVFSGKSLKIWGYSMKPPGAAITAAQVTASILEWLFAAASFYALLPAGAPGFKLFVASYAASEFLGMISNIPGGLGVFDAAVISFLSLSGPTNGPVISAVIFYRITYYLIPLVASYIIYGAAETEAAGKKLIKKAGEIKKLLSSTTGYFFSLVVFVSGAITLILAAFPVLQFRAAALDRLFPLPLSITFSVLCSLTGAGLIMLARGLQKSIISSLKLSVILLAADAVFLSATGLNYEISSLFLAVILLMIYFRGNFYRKTGAFTEKPTTGLFFSSSAVIALCAVLAWISYLLLPSPQNIKAMLSIGIAAVAIVIWMLVYLFKPYKPAPHTSSQYVINTASKIAFESHDSMSQLSLSGDKKIIFSWSGASFIMYAQCGTHWVALGDPYGPYTETEEMIWKFKRLARQNRGTPAFFNVSSDYMHFYQDAGFKFFKIGDEARVAIEYYPSDKKKDEKLVKMSDAMRSLGYVFRVHPRGANPLFFKSAFELSKEWLKKKHVKESGFITGIFDLNYLKRFHIAAVYKNDKLFAFANIFSSGDRGEFMIDMLRTAPDAPPEMVDYLKYRLLLWGKEKHYAFFNLGLVPVNAPEFNSFSPVGSSIGAALYNNSIKFTNAWALRKNREKFDPIWHPRFLVCGSFMDVPSIFSEIELLTKDGRN